VVDEHLNDEERQVLFEAAIKSEPGRRLEKYLWANAVLVERDRDLVDTISAGIVEAPDSGHAMAAAQWDDLSADEQRAVTEAVRKLLRRIVAESLTQFEDASGRLRISPRDIEPATVAVFAASSLVISGHRYEGQP
jgi:hypothetical protein